MDKFLKHSATLKALSFFLQLFYLRIPCVSMMGSSTAVPFTVHNASSHGMSVTCPSMCSMIQCSSFTLGPCKTNNQTSDVVNTNTNSWTNNQIQKLVNSHRFAELQWHLSFQP